MPKQSRVRIFAGPNGSGKTTLYQELASNFSSGYFMNADEIEKLLQTTRLIDLSSLNLNCTQVDLDNFKDLPHATTLLLKAFHNNFEIDITINENFIVNKPKTTNSYEASFVASFIRHLLLENKKSFSYETVMSHSGKL